jgi:hypothetical protein
MKTISGEELMHYIVCPYGAAPMNIYCTFINHQFFLDIPSSHLPALAHKFDKIT